LSVEHGHEVLMIFYTSWPNYNRCETFFAVYDKGIGHCASDVAPAAFGTLTPERVGGKETPSGMN